MGLDIHHFKATLERQEKLTDFNELTCVEENFDNESEDFIGANVPFSYFKRYFQQVDYRVDLQSVVFVSPTVYENLDSYWLDFLKPFFKIVITNDIKTSIEQNEMESNLRGIDFEESQNERWLTRTYYRIENRLGFYYQKIGYQRKGVNYPRFEERFNIEETTIYALKEDFEYLYNCIDYCWESDTEVDVKQRKEQFKLDFLDKFEDGASFLFMG